MTRAFALAAVTLGLAAPVPASDALTGELAESRLRGCLLAGASAAPTTNLREAVVAVRSFCAPQIGRVREARVAGATAGLSGHPAREAEDRAVRALNSEIAQAIANFTGLTE